MLLPPKENMRTAPDPTSASGSAGSHVLCESI